MNPVMRNMILSAFLFFMLFPSYTFARSIVQQDRKQRKVYLQDHKTAVDIIVENRRPPVTRINGSILKMEVRDGHVMLWLSARNQNDTPLELFSVEHITMIETVNGIPRRVPKNEVMLHTDSDALSITTVLLRDISRSLDATALAQVNEAMRAYIDQMQPNQQVGIIDFGSKIVVRHRFTTNKRALQAVLKPPTPENATAFYDGLRHAISSLREIPVHQSLQLAIVYTDGGDNHSQHSLDSVLHAAKENSIPIFCIGVGDAQESVLQQIAQDTRGAYFYAPETESLASVYQKIVVLLRDIVIVSFPTQASEDDTISVQAVIEYITGQQRIARQFESTSLKLSHQRQ